MKPAAHAVALGDQLGAVSLPLFARMRQLVLQAGLRLLGAGQICRQRDLALVERRVLVTPLGQRLIQGYDAALTRIQLGS